MQTPLKLDSMIEIEEFHYHKNDIITAHSCLWGDFNFSFNGVLEFKINQKLFLSPPSYGFWIPPHTEHCSVAVAEHITHYICIRIHPRLCKQLNIECKTLSISPFFRHTVAELLGQKKLNYPAKDYQQHLLQILFDQLLFASGYDQYLPQTEHPVLKPILQKLADPSRLNQSLPKIFAEIHFSERHILRLCQQELNMSVSEWRNRIKIIYAISQLQQGISIKRIGYDLGYQQSSSFISFFKRYTGQTPAQTRQF